MKVTKRSVALNAFNVFLVLGMVIFSASSPVSITISEPLFWIIRIGLPVTLGVVAALFTYMLLEWYEQTKVHGKADDEDKKANENQ